MTVYRGAPYPEESRDRDHWILAHRPARNKLDPQRPYAFLAEDECSATGETVRVVTIFLTSRECPWRCLMCDLWRNTLTDSAPQGSIPAQIDFALARSEPAREIKLYNNGSFFDRQAVPPDDYEEIAARLSAFERVIVECHPALIGEDCLRFRDLLNANGEPHRAPAELEIAMGLETVHPKVLPRLNKRMTLDQFSRAAGMLRKNRIELRVFVLIKPPFMDEPEALYWTERSLEFAFDCGATAVSLIPTRAGNGALDMLAKRGEFKPPKLATLEAAIAYGVNLRRGRVFADLWDLERFSHCASCFEARAVRLRQINLSQTVPPAIDCPACGEESCRGF